MCATIYRRIIKTKSFSRSIVIIKAFRDRKCKKKKKNTNSGVAEIPYYLLMPLWFRVAIRHGGGNESPPLYSSSRLQFRNETAGGTISLPPSLPLASTVFATSFCRCPLLNYCETIVFSYDRPTGCSRLGDFARLSSASGISPVHIHGIERARVHVCVLAVDSVHTSIAETQGESRNSPRYETRPLASLGARVLPVHRRPRIFHRFSNSDLRRLSS